MRIKLGIYVFIFISKLHIVYLHALLLYGLRNTKPDNNVFLYYIT